MLAFLDTNHNTTCLMIVALVGGPWVVSLLYLSWLGRRRRDGNPPRQQ